MKINKSRNKLNCQTLYIDALNMCFRQVFSKSGLKSNGVSTSVIFGVINNLKALIEKFNPKEVIFVLEGRGSRNRRKAIYPEYKAKRKTNLPISKEEFYGQINDLEDYLYALGVSVVKINTYEADDVIAVLSRGNINNSIIVSTDGDYLQLINEKIKVYNPTKEILIDLSNFREIVGVEPCDFLDFKIIVGDKSDNISGIKGVGKVTATAICNFMGYQNTIDAGEANVDPKFKKIFTKEGREQFRLADKLINLSHVELDLNVALNSIVKGNYDEDEIFDLLEDKRIFRHFHY